jgi:type VI secretion system protein ImpA
MTAGVETQTLLDPITDDRPCGEDLEDSSILAGLDSLRLFGQSKSPEAPPEPADGQEEKGREKPPQKPPPEWGQIKATANEALTKSKDLRALTYLSAALLRTDGLPAFCETLGVASTWLDTYWSGVYPLFDEDGIARRNALNCFADPMLVVDRVWRTPLVASRQHGRFSMRDVDLATGRVPVGADEPKPREEPINAAFGEMPVEELAALEQCVSNAIAALNTIDGKMRGEGGPEAAPDFDALSGHLVRMKRVLRGHLDARAGVEGEALATGEGAVAGAGGAYAGGAIRSRQDAIRALDAVADFFRRNEPSSPIPLIVDRAKRLVSKDFLEVLADIAPEALSTARAAGGIKEVHESS